MIIIDRRGLLDNVDTVALREVSMLSPALADQVIKDFDNMCNPNIKNPR